MRLASSIDRGCGYAQVVKNPSSLAWSAPAWATSTRPWPMLLQKSAESPSR